ncbi:MAG TPA: protein kinase, partial [Myxococcota bacterium]|nr:protein kinase [Myxococcota bacterium]
NPAVMPESSLFTPDPKAPPLPTGAVLDDAPDAADGAGWFARALARARPVDAKLAHERGAALYTWLKAHNLVRKGELENLYGRAETTSRIFTTPGAELRRSQAWLTSGRVQALLEMLIDRSHALVADPDASRQTSLKEALRRFAAHEGVRAGSRREVIDGRRVLHLWGCHYDGVYIDEDAPIARGGQGAFFVGVTAAGHPVAVKSLKRSSQPTEEHRMMRKAQKGGYLQRLTVSGSEYIVMSLLGGTLDDVAGHFLDDPALVDRRARRHWAGRYLLRELLRDLLVVHDSNMTHADIKPANFLYARPAMHIYVSDYGCAQEAQGGIVTKTGLTPGYASPEQVSKGSPLTAKTDVFSLAVSVTEMVALRAERLAKGRGLVGTIPDRFLIGKNAELKYAEYRRGRLDDAVTRRHFDAVHRRLRSFDPQLAALLCDMLEPDPAARPSAEQVRNTWEWAVGIPKAQRLRIVQLWRQEVPERAPGIDAGIERAQSLHAALRTAGALEALP